MPSRQNHPWFERKRYTLKTFDGTPLHTETKIIEMKLTQRYKRLFASNLLKVDKNTKNIEYTNERGNQLYKIEKLVVYKPIPIEKPKAI